MVVFCNDAGIRVDGLVKGDIWECANDRCQHLLGPWKVLICIHEVQADTPSDEYEIEYLSNLVSSGLSPQCRSLSYIQQ